MKTAFALAALSAALVLAPARNLADDFGQGVEPTSPAPTWIPPPPTEVDATTGQEVVVQQGVPAGQWVFTSQYGWVWMPFGTSFTFLPASGATPNMFVYYPAIGWSWVIAPWVWGWGPRPWFGYAGWGAYPWWGTGFGTWYGFARPVGWAGWGGWHGGGYWYGGRWTGVGPGFPAPPRPGYGAPPRPGYGAPPRPGAGAPPPPGRPVAGTPPGARPGGAPSRGVPGAMPGAVPRSTTGAVPRSTGAALPRGAPAYAPTAVGRGLAGQGQVRPSGNAFAGRSPGVPARTFTSGGWGGGTRSFASAPPRGGFGGGGFSGARAGGGFSGGGFSGGGRGGGGGGGHGGGGGGRR